MSRSAGRSRSRSAIGAAARGVAAGALGTLAMTVWQELAARVRGGGSSDSWESSQQPEDPWVQAPVPAKVARRAVALFGWDVGPERIQLLTNVMPARELALDLSYHLVYGIGTGSAFALVDRLT
jgi:hypothetical protein